MFAWLVFLALAVGAPGGKGAVLVSGEAVREEEVSEPGPRIALTFDDGPGPYTDVYKRQLLEILLGNVGLEVTDRLSTRFYCNCSKERVEQAVASIGRKDIQEMIEEGKDIEVKCHFCNTA